MPDTAMIMLETHLLNWFLGQGKDACTKTAAGDGIFMQMQADAMTTSELDAFRQHVRQRLAEAEEESGHPIMYTFSAAADAHEGKRSWRNILTSN